jgi:hypothetical protein
MMVEESSSEEEEEAAPLKKHSSKKASKKASKMVIQEDVSTLGGSIGANFGALTMEEKRKQLAIMTKQLEDEEVAVAFSSKTIEKID